MEQPEADTSVQGGTTVSSTFECSADVRSVRVPGLGTRPVRVIVLSDTHSLHSMIPPNAVPPGDLLIHCGDFTAKETADEVKAFDSFLAGLPHATKLVIAGNHDVGVFCEFEARRAKELLPHGRYLDNELVEVEGLKIYGSSWDRRGGRTIPPGVDILVTHDPPHGILDAGLGCKCLREEVADRGPGLHVFGHIHEACGVVRAGNGGGDVARTTFVNAAMANDGMRSKCLDKPMTLIDIVP